MKNETLINQNGIDRLRKLRHNGVSILVCDFSNCTRDDGVTLLQELISKLKDEAPNDVRLLVDASYTTHDPSQTNEWKRHLDLFDSKLKKTAIVGLGPLNRIALGGVRMYAKLMGLEKATLQAQVFEGREPALDYLATEK